MHTAHIYSDGLGFVMIIGPIARRFTTMSHLVDFCNNNNINAYFSPCHYTYM